MTTAETAPPALYAAAADIGIAEPDVHVSGIVADLVAVLVAVTAGEPRVLTLQDARALPSGPFELTHRSLQSGLRAWVERQAIIRSAMSSSFIPSPIATAASHPTSASSRSPISG